MFRPETFPFEKAVAAPSNASTRGRYGLLFTGNMKAFTFVHLCRTSRVLVAWAGGKGWQGKEVASNCSHVIENGK